MATVRVRYIVDDDIVTGVGGSQILVVTARSGRGSRSIGWPRLTC